MEGRFDIPNTNNVYTLTRRGVIRKGIFRVIKQTLDKASGYYKVQLWVNKKQKMCLVHRLIAQTFIPNPKNLPQINHKDGNKRNNNIDNLEWVTDKENKAHGYKNGFYNNLYGSKNHKAKLDELDVHTIRGYLKEGMSAKTLADSYVVSPQHIRLIGRRKSWKHLV